MAVSRCRDCRQQGCMLLQKFRQRLAELDRNPRLGGCANQRPVEETIHPRLQVWQTVVDGRLVALFSDEKRNIGDIRQRIVPHNILPAFHLAIQSSQIFFQFLGRLFDFKIVGDFTAGVLQPRVAVIDPYPCPRAPERVLRHKRYLRIFLFQVFVDDRRFVDDGVAIYQYGNFAVGVSFKQLFRLVFEIAFDELVGYLFFRQDKPCPVGIRSGTVR
jgi:hypothetical protein